MCTVYSLVALLTDTLDGATILPQCETASVTVKSKKGEADLVHTMKAYRGCYRHSALILNMNTGWMWMVSFMPWPVYPQGKNLCYQLNTRLGWPQN
jgi:hypothetical protein